MKEWIFLVLLPSNWNKSWNVPLWKSPKCLIFLCGNQQLHKKDTHIGLIHVFRVVVFLNVHIIITVLQVGLYMNWWTQTVSHLKMCIFLGGGYFCFSQLMKARSNCAQVSQIIFSAAFVCRIYYKIFKIFSDFYHSASWNCIFFSKSIPATVLVLYNWIILLKRFFSSLHPVTLEEKDESIRIRLFTHLSHLSFWFLSLKSTLCSTRPSNTTHIRVSVTWPAHAAHMLLTFPGPPPGPVRGEASAVQVDGHSRSPVRAPTRHRAPREPSAAPPPRGGRPTHHCHSRSGSPRGVGAAGGAAGLWRLLLNYAAVNQWRAREDQWGGGVTRGIQIQDASSQRLTFYRMARGSEGAHPGSTDRPSASGDISSNTINKPHRSEGKRFTEGNWAVGARGELWRRCRRALESGWREHYRTMKSREVFLPPPVRSTQCLISQIGWIIIIRLVESTPLSLHANFKNLHIKVNNKMLDIVCYISAFCSFPCRTDERCLWPAPD